MKRILLLFCLLLCATLAHVGITIGTVTAEGNVNVRSTPDVREGNIVGFLPNGSECGND